MDSEIYRFMGAAVPYLVLWSFAFTLITSVRAAIRLGRGLGKARDNALLTELAGLPLTVLLSVCFVLAAWHGDWASMLLFLWWGPGFVATLAALLIARLRRRRIDWHPFRYVISYLCKLYYLAFLVVFLVQGVPGMIFAFSVWIINDQYEKAFLSLDADRTRRTFHDFWLPRVLYPAGLLVPCFDSNMPLRPFAIIYGIALLCLWGAGLFLVARKKLLFCLPDDPSLLRNMVYFPKLRVGDTPSTTPSLESASAPVPAGHPVEAPTPR
jgi:hypothetical protein